MKTYKTNSGNRSTYTYTDAMGKTYTIKPGDKDPITGQIVTEDMIWLLHQMDDNEVNNNVKSTRVPVQEWEEPIIAEWKAEHPGEDMPTRMHVSIDDAGEGMDGGEGDAEKGFIAKASVEAFRAGEESPMIERLHEVITMLRPDQQELYRRIVIEGENACDIARELGTDSSAVRHRMATIKAFIKNNF